MEATSKDTVRGAGATDRMTDPAEKWQRRWEEFGLFRAPAMPGAKKYMVMPMFAYPSGDMHMGHFRNYTITDAIARRKMMQGYDVMHPFGWDAFGLPAEQAAIKHGLPPAEWTKTNIAQSKATLIKSGVGFDWSREVSSCDPGYYKWTQWFFVKLFEKGLAVRRSSLVNWCEHCNTVLANEQVEQGNCWRCGNAVRKKRLPQWYFRITEYAARLLDDIDGLDGWPESLKALQRNWIGRSEGAEIDFVLPDGRTLTVFTTRPDTIYGATFMVMAPDGPLVETLDIPDERRADVDAYVAKTVALSDVDRIAKTEKDGVPTGVMVTNPVSGERVELWLADYVLAGYGTGCIMAVPAHDQRDFEFARKYDLPIRRVIALSDDEPAVDEMSEATEGEGTMVNSGPFDGKVGRDGVDAVIAHLEEKSIGRGHTQYKLRDWLVSRQRYWGAPIPIIHCDDCGVVAVPESDLPVELPGGIADFMPKGRSPLADVPEFMTVDCPKCGKAAQRDADTMDTFVCSSWYYQRYCDPHNDAQAFDPAKANAWLPIDMYVGGITHATGHLIYFRFFHKFLKDLGYLATDEPAVRMFNHGMVSDANGEVMSKSKGNVVSPIDLMRDHGVDAARISMFFTAPSEKEVQWSDAGIVGAERFVARVGRLVDEAAGIEVSRRGDGAGATFAVAELSEAEQRLWRKLHQAIRQIDVDAERLQFNTHIAALMELLNEVPSPGAIDDAVLFAFVCRFVQLLAPLAPHWCEEWWERLGHTESVFRSTWPVLDKEATTEEMVSVAVQINGKVRGQVEIAPDASEDVAVAAARATVNVSRYLEGGELVKVIYRPGRMLSLVVRG